MAELLRKDIEQPGGSPVRAVHATVRDDDGREYTFTFPSDPTDQQVLDRLPKPRRLVPTVKADIEEYVDELYQAWLRWDTTAKEAALRALPSQVLTALNNRTDQAWADYATALNAWRQAT
jgi:hypothetical protein